MELLLSYQHTCVIALLAFSQMDCTLGLAGSRCAYLVGFIGLSIVLLVSICWQVLHPFLLYGLVPIYSVMETIDSIYAPVAAEDTSELGGGSYRWLHV